MATPAERKALLFFALAAMLGASTRVLRGYKERQPPGVESRQALARQLAAVDSARQARSTGGKGRGGTRSGAGRKGAKERRKAGPDSTAAAGPRRPVDLDRATAQEIEALPGVGPVLARRIVAERDSCGPFGSLEGLRRVRGVGDRLARRLDSLVTFSLPPRPKYVILPGCAGGSRQPQRARRERA